MRHHENLSWRLSCIFQENMKPADLMAVLRTVNLGAVGLALSNPSAARTYVSTCLQRYDEAVGRGLPCRDPLGFLKKRRGGRPLPVREVRVPVFDTAEGGTRPAETVILATVTSILQPRVVFEIGTFTGRTTSVFILNSPPGARVLSLDLPPDVELDTTARQAYIDTDVALVVQRKLAKTVYELGLQHRYEQILADSMTFHPAPYEGTVELGFIDGAHAREYVENDTHKMAQMMSTQGLVFWHDYGGRGRFRGLTSYLEELGRRIKLYRVRGTTLAWTSGEELRKVR